MNDEKDLTVLTRVAHSGHGEAFFCGRALVVDLVGRVSMGEVFATSVLKRSLREEDYGLLDDAMAALCLADPRIWPLKNVRLVASYGSENHGIASGLLIQHTPLLGGAVAPAAAKLLLDLSREVGDEKDRKRKVRRFIKSHKFIPGFGVPLRENDERLAVLRRSVCQRHRQDGRYWRLMELAIEVIAQQRGVPANIGIGIAALCLDLGFSIQEIGALGLVFGLPCLVANAFEESQQQNPCLQRLPADRVRYVGRQPRVSPRAAAAATEGG